MEWANTLQKLDWIFGGSESGVSRGIYKSTKKQNKQMYKISQGVGIGS